MKSIKKTKISRRVFNRQVLITGSAGILLPEILRSQEKRKKSIVVVAQSRQLQRKHHQVSQAAARKYIDKALARITKLNSAEKAWTQLFTPTERVGIKLSCLPGKPLSSSRGVVMAIISGLLSAGVKAKNIIVWERTDRELKDAGFALNELGPLVYGTDHVLGGGYARDVEISGRVGTCFSQIIKSVDALINVPVLKDHDIAGVSIGMKNFYGAIHNPNKFHDNHCDPYVAHLCQHPYIKNKLRLTVCDATRIQIHNGPAFYPRYAHEYGGLLIGTDPVALDFIGWQIIEGKRREAGLKSLKEENREPTYIFTAADLKLGQANKNLIKVERIS